ncbi:hypothetical protein GA0070564_10685 [Micromonospora mirobrigensis]|uniref:Uncharacterized protein n=1 Tax=Micromonospora mirobrigensis TaxID=262898 RepID=A0A1C4ZN56_9ACTN|nr:hypothetical protein GA0070564_10685 [Micromonospora mirobrigensis]
MAAGGYLLLISIVALVAAAHPDEKRRHDAAKVLDKLMKFGRGRSRLL